MNLLQAIVLGVVQGLTEFLPISSSAHLVVVPWLLGWDEPGLAFDAALHLGTLVAVLCYFWRELLGMVMALPIALTRPRSLLRDLDPGRGWDAAAADANGSARLALLVAIGTLPGLIAGVVGQGAIDDLYHGDGISAGAIAAIAVALMLLGLLLWVAEGAAAQQRRIGHLTWRDAVTIGLAQATALVPGVSRSGATITAGLFQGLHRADAARFSFLLGVPIIAAAGSKGLLDIVGDGLSRHDLGLLAVGVVTSAIVGFAAIWGLLQFLQRSTTRVFTLYRLGLGLFLLALLAGGFR